MTPKKLAVFDIDGTIFRSSLLIELVEALVREGIFRPEAAEVYRNAHEAWADREGSYQTYIDSVVVALKQNLKGIAYKDVRRIAYKVVARHKGRTYRFTRDLIRELKAKRYYLLAISHSPKIVTEAFAKAWGFNKVYGIMYEVGVDGRFTGKILYEDLIKAKDKILERVLTDSGTDAVGGVTLRGSVGVGDTESDIPFLTMVAKPICFNPNQKLYQMAKRRGWEVVVERKDVVYRM
jgi:HAD superfamily hydrolase (TIGR01490 family)